MTDTRTSSFEAARGSNAVAIAACVLCACESDPVGRLRPDIFVSPAPLELGDIVVGVIVRGELNVENRGTSVLEVSGLKADSPASFVDATARAVAPSGRVGLGILLVGNETGELETWVHVESNDSDSPVVDVKVTARVVAPGASGDPPGIEGPAMCVEPTALVFGGVPIGSTKRLPLTVRSCGSSPLVLRRAASTSAEFRLGSWTPQSLDPGQSATLEVEYQPGSRRTHDAFLELESSLPTKGYVPLSGAGLGCDLQAIPSALDFGAVGSAGQTRRVVLSNGGALACAIRRLSLGAGSPEFTIRSAPTLPLTLGPGETSAVELSYLPVDAGSDQSTLEIETDDPGTVSIVVPLTGHTPERGECLLEAVPSPVSFGAVRMGTSARAGVVVTNRGDDVCSVTRVALEASSSSAFHVASSGLPMVIRPGRSETIEVDYSPQGATPDVGMLELSSGLLPPRRALSVPLFGSGSGPRLCITPTFVAFGAHSLGTTATRPLTLSSCGTEDLVVSGLLFDAGVTPELGLGLVPVLPFTLAPGATAVVEVRHVPLDVGRDDGTILISSNDPIDSEARVQVIASAGDGCGDIIGEICGIDGAEPLAGVTVWVEGPNGTVDTVTDPGGRFVLTCVPGGEYTLRARSGAFDATLSARVDVGVITELPRRVCLDPSSADVAVVQGEWDQMEVVLDSLRVPNAKFSAGGGRSLLEDISELGQYEIVFFDCGMDETLVLSSRAISNLRAFVALGGSVYASDWSYDVVELGWPGAVDFAGDDSFVDNAQGGPGFEGAAEVVEPSLQVGLGGRTRIPISIMTSGAGIDGTDPSTVVYMQADRYGDGQRAVMIGFQPGPGAGRVMYTDFHNSGQADVEDLFRWLIQQL